MRQLTKVTKNQSGLVSIIITMFLMMIISLIVIGFAKISRREQRQVLDRQLSTQAFYAAESGINDAVHVLRTTPNAAKPNCNDVSASAALTGLKKDLDASTGVSYTCLLVEPTPGSLVYDTINTDKATVIPINSVGTAKNINYITLSWQDTDGGKDFSDCPTHPKLPPSDKWTPMDKCDAGMLRIDLVPKPAATFSRDNLMNSTLTAFLYPKSLAGKATASFASASGSNAGAIIAANCDKDNTPRLCNLTINSGLGGESYYLHVRSIYKPNSLTVTASGDGTTDLALSGGQILIDSTGKAGDVLRRIAVRLDVGSLGSGAPGFAIQSRDTICKRFFTRKGFASYDNTSVPSATDSTPCNVN